MKFPRCGGSSRVEETRKTRQGDSRRYRRCAGCRLRFTTVEALDASSRRVAKRRDVPEPFSRNKIAKSITKAVVRDLPHAELNRMVDRVVEIVMSEEPALESTAQLAGQDADLPRPIEAERIGTAIMQVLHSDVRYHVILARFALLFQATYGGFSDAQTFLDWLDAENLARHAPREISKTPEWVVKRDGTLAPFDEDKLRRSIRYAAKKKPKAEEEVADAQFGEQILGQVLSAVCYQRLVTSGQLATEIMRVLHPTSRERIRRGLTQGERELAYLRVASTAKNYTRIEDFALEARGLLSAMKEHDLRSDDGAHPHTNVGDG